MVFTGVIPAAPIPEAPFGLFSAATVVERGPRDEHWAGGFDAMSESCTFDASIVDICSTALTVDIYVASGDRFQRIRPFGILAVDECTSIGFDVEDRRARVVRQLDVVTQKAVEKEYWAGVYRAPYEASIPAGQRDPGAYLADPTTVKLTTTAQKAAVALALLEQGLADCGPGYRGVIHMSPLVASFLGDSLHDEDGKLLTNNGNYVAVGTGYDGRGPGDASAPAAGSTTHWLYATGPMYVVLGSKELITVNEQQATNAKTNVMTYAAERPAAVYSDGCCMLAAQANIAT